MPGWQWQSRLRSGNASRKGNDARSISDGEELAAQLTRHTFQCLAAAHKVLLKLLCIVPSEGSSPGDEETVSRAIGF